MLAYSHLTSDYILNDIMFLLTLIVSIIQQTIFNLKTTIMKYYLFTKQDLSHYSRSPKQVLLYYTYLCSYFKRENILMHILRKFSNIIVIRIFF